MRGLTALLFMSAFFWRMEGYQMISFVVKKFSPNVDKGSIDNNIQLDDFETNNKKVSFDDIITLEKLKKLTSDKKPSTGNKNFENDGDVLLDDGITTRRFSFDDVITLPNLKNKGDSDKKSSTNFEFNGDVLRDNSEIKGKRFSFDDVITLKTLKNKGNSDKKPLTDVEFGDGVLLDDSGIKGKRFSFDDVITSKTLKNKGNSDKKPLTDVEIDDGVLLDDSGIKGKRFSFDDVITSKTLKNKGNSDKTFIANDKNFDNNIDADGEILLNENDLKNLESDEKKSSINDNLNNLKNFTSDENGSFEKLSDYYETSASDYEYPLIDASTFSEQLNIDEAESLSTDAIYKSGIVENARNQKKSQEAVDYNNIDTLIQKLNALRQKILQKRADRLK